MQAYGRLALEDNSGVGKAVQAHVFLAPAAVPSRSQPKEADPQIAMGPSGRGFGDFPYL